MTSTRGKGDHIKNQLGHLPHCCCMLCEVLAGWGWDRRGRLLDRRGVVTGVTALNLLWRRLPSSQMSMPGQQPPKMVEVEGAFVGPEADVARARMIAAGYNVESCELKKVPHLLVPVVCLLICARVLCRFTATSSLAARS